MREVASNLSRRQHQDVISDPFPSSIDIFETNPDIISFEGGRIVIVRDLLWLWGMNYWLSQIFRNKGHLYLGTGYEIEILVSQLRLPPQPPLYPPKKSRQTIHVLENNVILCFESHPTCMNWIHLVPLKNHSARNGHQNPSLFGWTVCILIKGTPHNIVSLPHTEEALRQKFNQNSFPIVARRGDKLFKVSAWTIVRHFFVVLF